MTTFTFDGQLHIPLKRIEETLETAIERELDLVVFTDYGSTRTFDVLCANKDQDKKPILHPRQWNIHQRSLVVLEIIGEKGRIHVLKGEEVKTKQGHVLAWGIAEPIENGVDVYDCIREVYRQGGIPVFSHLLMLRFAGCGKEVFQEAYYRFSGYPLGVEDNGQIPDSYDENHLVRKLAKEYGVACFGTSDIHGDYLQEHKKIGLRKHTRTPPLDQTHFTEELSDLMLTAPDKILVQGSSNKALETYLWNAASILRNGWPKIRELLQNRKA